MLYTRVCSVPGCLAPNQARGVCNTHYKVWHTINSNYENIAEYVNSYYEKRRKCSCDLTPDNMVKRTSGDGRSYYACRKCYNKKQSIREKAKRKLKAEIEQPSERICLGCGVAFSIEYKRGSFRQVFCSKICGNRASYKRIKDAKAKQDSEKNKSSVSTR